MQVGWRRTLTEKDEGKEFHENDGNGDGDKRGGDSNPTWIKIKKK